MCVGVRRGCVKVCAHLCDLYVCKEIIHFQANLLFSVIYFCFGLMEGKLSYDPLMSVCRWFGWLVCRSVGRCVCLVISSFTSPAPVGALVFLVVSLLFPSVHSDSYISNSLSFLGDIVFMYIQFKEIILSYVVV